MWYLRVKCVACVCAFTTDTSWCYQLQDDAFHRHSILGTPTTTCSFDVTGADTTEWLNWTELNAQMIVNIFSNKVFFNEKKIKMTVRTDCAISACSPLLQPIKALAHWLSAGCQPLDMSPLSPLVTGLQNKANFPFYQPCLSSIDFLVASSWTPLLITSLPLKWWRQDSLPC